MIFLYLRKKYLSQRPGQSEIRSDALPFKNFKNFQPRPPPNTNLEEAKVTPAQGDGDVEMQDTDAAEESKAGFGAEASRIVDGVC